MTELLPCPFCGGDGVIGWDEVYTPHGDLPGEKARVICEDCLAATDYRVDREEAIALWNRRVEPKVTVEIHHITEAMTPENICSRYLWIWGLALKEKV